MLGDSVTVTLGGSGGTARVLKKINQDNYSAEYLGRVSTDELRLRIRHTKEKAGANGNSLDRHNFELTQTVFATLTDPEIVRQFYFVWRALPSDDAVAAQDLAEAVVYFSDAANLAKILGWES